MMKKREYSEGKDAKQKFEGAMKTIFRAPKQTKAAKPKLHASGAAPQQQKPSDRS
jgi:hypothetical protein